MAKKKLAKSYKFDATGRNIIPITLTSEDGVDLQYVIEEMNGKNLSDWRDYQLNGDKKYYHTTLIEKCLRPVGEHPRLSAKEITDKYYASVIMRLFEICSHVNGFMDEIEMTEEGEAKKE